MPDSLIEKLEAYKAELCSHKHKHGQRCLYHDTVNECIEIIKGDAANRKAAEPVLSRDGSLSSPARCEISVGQHDLVSGKRMEFKVPLAGLMPVSGNWQTGCTYCGHDFNGHHEECKWFEKKSDQPRDEV